MQAEAIKISLPFEVLSSHPRIYPFFIPFRGCKLRCLFCAQDIVTQVNESNSSLEPSLNLAQKELESSQGRRNEPLELAFYGGTFTNLAWPDFELCLKYTKNFIDRGLISRARCSTRPDGLAKERLQALALAGFTTIELGIQSFVDAALSMCLRAYSAKEAREACKKVKDWGFKLGVQLLCGMPSTSENDFLRDVSQAIELSADYLRFYPCLVLAKTGLANLYNQGKYIPWDLDTTIKVLARGFNLAAKAQVHVIRMGLAPQMDFSQVLAGPWVYDLGARVQAKALFSEISATLKNYPNYRLSQLALPRNFQGFFWGHKRNLTPSWKSLGIDNTILNFCDQETIVLELVPK